MPKSFKAYGQVDYVYIRRNEYLIKRPDKPNEDDVVPCDCAVRASANRPLASLWGSSRASTARNSSNSDLKLEVSASRNKPSVLVESSVESSNGSSDDPHPLVPQKGKGGREKNEQGKEHIDCCTATCLCRMLQVSCSKHCGCQRRCLNAPFQLLRQPKLSVVKQDACGWGVKARQNIPPGSFVCEYVGEVIDEATCEQRLWDQRNAGERDFYLCEISNSVIIDARYKGNIARFINHSCAPNCDMKKWEIDGEVRVGIFSSRRIKEGEFLSYDYQMVGFEPQRKACHCGAAECRGVMDARNAVMGDRQALSSAAPRFATQTPPQKGEMRASGGDEGEGEEEVGDEEGVEEEEQEKKRGGVGKKRTAAKGAKGSKGEKGEGDRKRIKASKKVDCGAKIAAKAVRGGKTTTGAGLRKKGMKVGKTVNVQGKAAKAAAKAKSGNAKSLLSTGNSIGTAHSSVPKGEQESEEASGRKGNTKVPAGRKTGGKVITSSAAAAAAKGSEPKVQVQGQLTGWIIGKKASTSGKERLAAAKQAQTGTKGGFVIPSKASQAGLQQAQGGSNEETIAGDSSQGARDTLVGCKSGGGEGEGGGLGNFPVEPVTAQAGSFSALHAFSTLPTPPSAYQGFRVSDVTSRGARTGGSGTESVREGDSSGDDAREGERKEVGVRCLPEPPLTPPVIDVCVPAVSVSVSWVGVKESKVEGEQKESDNESGIIDGGLKEREDGLQEKQDGRNESEDVGKESEDGMEEFEDALKGSEDVVKESEDCLNVSEDVVKGSEDGLKMREYVARVDEDGRKDSENVAKESGKVVIEGEVPMKKSEDVTKESEDVTKEIEDMVKVSEYMVKVSEDVKESEGVVKESEKVAQESDDVVEVREGGPKLKECGLQQSENELKQSENVNTESDNWLFLLVAASVASAASQTPDVHPENPPQGDTSPHHPPPHSLTPPTALTVTQPEQKHLSPAALGGSETGDMEVKDALRQVLSAPLLPAPLEEDSQTGGIEPKAGESQVPAPLHPASLMPAPLLATSLESSETGGIESKPRESQVRQMAGECAAGGRIDVASSVDDGRKEGVTGEVHRSLAHCTAATPPGTSCPQPQVDATATPAAAPGNSPAAVGDGMVTDTSGGHHCTLADSTMPLSLSTSYLDPKLSIELVSAAAPGTSPVAVDIREVEHHGTAADCSTATAISVQPQLSSAVVLAAATGSPIVAVDGRGVKEVSGGRQGATADCSAAMADPPTLHHQVKEAVAEALAAAAAAAPVTAAVTRASGKLGVTPIGSVAMPPPASLLHQLKAAVAAAVAAAPVTAATRVAGNQAKVQQEGKEAASRGKSSCKRRKGEGVVDYLLEGRWGKRRRSGRRRMVFSSAAVLLPLWTEFDADEHSRLHTVSDGGEIAAGAPVTWRGWDRSGVNPKPGVGGEGGSRRSGEDAPVICYERKHRRGGSALQRVTGEHHTAARYNTTRDGDESGVTATRRTTTRDGDESGVTAARYNTTRDGDESGVTAAGERDGCAPLLVVYSRKVKRQLCQHPSANGDCNPDLKPNLNPYYNCNPNPNPNPKPRSSLDSELVTHPGPSQDNPVQMDCSVRSILGTEGTGMSLKEDERQPPAKKLRTSVGRSKLTIKGRDKMDCLSAHLDHQQDISLLLTCGTIPNTGTTTIATTTATTTSSLWALPVVGPTSTRAASTAATAATSSPLTAAVEDLSCLKGASSPPAERSPAAQVAAALAAVQRLVSARTPPGEPSRGRKGGGSKGGNAGKQAAGSAGKLAGSAKGVKAGAAVAANGLEAMRPASVGSATASGVTPGRASAGVSAGIVAGKKAFPASAVTKKPSGRAAGYATGTKAAVTAGGAADTKSEVIVTEGGGQSQGAPSQQGQGGKQGTALIGRLIEVWWPLEQRFFTGRILGFNPATGKHRVEYDDGDAEVLQLKNERWRFLASPASQPTSKQAGSQVKGKGKDKASLVDPSAGSRLGMSSLFSSAGPGSTARDMGQLHRRVRDLHGSMIRVWSQELHRFRLGKVALIARCKPIVEFASEDGGVEILNLLEARWTEAP